MKQPTHHLSWLKTFLLIICAVCLVFSSSISAMEVRDEDSDDIRTSISCSSSFSDENSLEASEEEPLLLIRFAEVGELSEEAKEESLLLSLPLEMQDYILRYLEPISLYFLGRTCKELAYIDIITVKAALDLEKLNQVYASCRPCGLKHVWPTRRNQDIRKLIEKESKCSALNRYVNISSSLWEEVITKISDNRERYPALCEPEDISEFMRRMNTKYKLPAAQHWREYNFCQLFNMFARDRRFVGGMTFLSLTAFTVGLWYFYNGWGWPLSPPDMEGQVNTYFENLKDGITFEVPVQDESYITWTDFAVRDKLKPNIHLLAAHCYEFKTESNINTDYFTLEYLRNLIDYFNKTCGNGMEFLSDIRNSVLGVPVSHTIPIPIMGCKTSTDGNLSCCEVFRTAHDRRGKHFYDHLFVANKKCIQQTLEEEWATLLSLYSVFCLPLSFSFAIMMLVSMYCC